MVKQAAPMTPQILVEIFEVVDFSDGVQFAAWTALLSGFYLLFRKSNLVPDTSVTFLAAKQLSCENLFRMRDCYIAWAYWSKTIQFHGCYLEIPMLPNPDLRLFLVYWLDRYFGSVAGTPWDLAFCYIKDRANMSLSYPQLSFWLKEWLTMKGYEPTLFSSHSVRRGGMQWTVQSGLPHHLIKLLADWKSAAYERYLDMTLQECYDAMLLFNMSMTTNQY